jgi:hypothetical protein
VPKSKGMTLYCYYIKKTLPGIGLIYQKKYLGDEVRKAANLILGAQHYELM